MGAASFVRPMVVGMVMVIVEDGLVMVDDSVGSGGLESPSGVECGSDNGRSGGLMLLGVVAMDGAEGDSGRGASCAFLRFLNLDLSLLRMAFMLPKALSGVECGSQPDPY